MVLAPTGGPPCDHRQSVHPVVRFLPSAPPHPAAPLLFFRQVCADLPAEENDSSQAAIARRIEAVARGDLPASQPALVATHQRCGPRDSPPLGLEQGPQSCRQPRPRRCRRRGPLLRPKPLSPLFRTRHHRDRREGSEDAARPTRYAQEDERAGFGDGVRARGRRAGATRRGRVGLHEAVVPGHAEGGARRRHHHAGACRPYVPQWIRVNKNEQKIYNEYLKQIRLTC